MATAHTHRWAAQMHSNLAKPIITLDINNAIRYYQYMIKSFRDKETEKIYNRERSRGYPYDIQRISLKKLWMIDAATDINTLKVPPENRLEVLKGDRMGTFSIRINDRWRICFKWSDNNAYDVEIVDYH